MIFLPYIHGVLQFNKQLQDLVLTATGAFHTRKTITSRLTFNKFRYNVVHIVTP